MSWEIDKPKERIDWTKDFASNYLLYGESKVGKTYLACDLIKDILTKDATSNAYILNTDKGFAKPAMQQGLDAFKERINYYPITDIQQAINIINELKTKVKSNDVILFDLLSWVWDESQKEFVSQLSGDDTVNFIKRAMNDEKKYGMFQGLQWGYIKKIDDMISSYLARNPICNIIALARVKGVEMEYAMSKKKPDIWLQLGRPDARKDISFEFANIIRIAKNDKGDREFFIVGTREKDTEAKWIEFKTSEEFWKKVREEIE